MISSFISEVTRDVILPCNFSAVHNFVKFLLFFLEFYSVVTRMILVVG